MNEGTAVAIRDDGDVDVTGLPTEVVVAQIAKIQELMSRVMKEGQHYGTIPGTDKPTLLKPGAEKLNMVFRLAPDRIYTWRDLGGQHRECQVVTRLRHIGSGAMVGEGIGVCSTMESKYRWRNQAITSDAGPVPKAYWDIDRDDWKARQAVLAQTFGAGKYRTKKVDGEWRALKVEGDGERIENPDIADTYNTVAKMATKRADVAATLTATAASDIFTQDLEETQDGRGGGKTEQKTTQPTQEKPLSEAQKLYFVILDTLRKAEAKDAMSHEQAKGYQKEMNTSIAEGGDNTMAELHGIHKRVADLIAGKLNDAMADPDLDAAAEAGWNEGDKPE